MSNIPLLIDTGAGATLLARSAIARLRVTPDPTLQYELIGFRIFQLASSGSRTARHLFHSLNRRDLRT